MTNRFKRLAGKVRSLRTEILETIAGTVSHANGKVSLYGHLVHLTEEGGVRVEAVTHDIALERGALVLHYSNTENWTEGQATLKDLPLEDLAGLLDVIALCNA